MDRHPDLDPQPQFIPDPAPDPALETRLGKEIIDIKRVAARPLKRKDGMMMSAPNWTVSLVAVIKKLLKLYSVEKPAETLRLASC